MKPNNTILIIFTWENLHSPRLEWFLGGLIFKAWIIWENWMVCLTEALADKWINLKVDLF